MDEITRILYAIEKGERVGADQLLPLVYDDLRKLAAVRLARESPGHTLDATALVHEAYLRIIGPRDSAGWEGRGHFFAAAAEAMRRILVENARRKRTEKHGGNRVRRDLDLAAPAVPEDSDDLLALDEALNKLNAADPSAARLVTLRYFTGLTIPQAAEMLQVSPRSADRLWAYARAFLHAEIYEKDQ